MTKFIFIVLWSCLCLAGSLAPEFAMYFSWNLIHPETDVMRVFVLAIFWFAGAGMSLMFGILGFFVWIAGVSGIAEA